MKPSNALVCLTALAHGVSAVATPETLDTRTPQPDFESYIKPSTNEELWKRKGGGGGGGRGGGGGSGGGGGGGRGGSGGGRGGAGAPSNNQGGRTTTGTGPPPRYGGGGFYGGGASAPYPAGRQVGSIVPALLVGTAVGSIAFLGFSYLHGAYVYPYHNQYWYHNATTNMNETKPVICVCDPYNPCACDDNGNQTYFNSVIGDGSYQNLNHSLVNIAKNETTGRLTIYINGQEPNGTTAAGGTDEPDTDVDSDSNASTGSNVDSAGASMIALAQAAGWWPAATVAFALAFLM